MEKDVLSPQCSEMDIGNPAIGVFMQMVKFEKRVEFHRIEIALLAYIFVYMNVPDQFDVTEIKPTVPFLHQGNVQDPIRKYFLLEFRDAAFILRLSVTTGEGKSTRVKVDGQKRMESIRRVDLEQIDVQRIEYHVLS